MCGVYGGVGEVCVWGVLLRDIKGVKYVSKGAKFQIFAENG